jgi:hypothetical protein
MMTGRVLTRILLCCSTVLLPALCSCINQYQRQYLGDPIMQLNPDPEGGALERHIFPRREGSSGGDDAAGGGCGC